MKLKDKIKKEWERFVKRVYAALGMDSAQDTPQPQKTQNTQPTSEANADSNKPDSPLVQNEGNANNGRVDSSDIKLHSFGSPNVGKCRFAGDAIIDKFKMDKNGMSYKWVNGGCENLGAKDRTDASATLAVCGYSNNGVDYHVCKFDWISTSRTTRSWENVRDRYNGIDPDAFFGAPHHCFFICDKHGNYRTNILTD